MQKNRIGLKGPMMTPIGKGFRSLNLTLRKELQVPRLKATVSREQVLVVRAYLAFQRGCAGVLSNLASAVDWSSEGRTCGCARLCIAGDQRS